MVGRLYRNVRVLFHDTVGFSFIVDSSLALLFGTSPKSTCPSCWFRKACIVRVALRQAPVAFVNSIVSD